MQNGSAIRPAQIRAPSTLAASPVLPSSTSVPVAESSRASLPVRACNCRACCPLASASPKDTR
jgi:hypothetical protein